MIIPQYKPDHRYSYFELANKHPEYAALLDNPWAQFEQKPNLMGLPPEVVKMIPQECRDGKPNDRIDAWIITNK